MNFESIIWKVKPIIEIGDNKYITIVIVVMSLSIGGII